MPHQPDPKPEPRRCTQTTEESHGSCVWPRRSKSLVSLFHALFQFRLSSFRPRYIIDVQVECSVARQLADKWHEVISNGESGQSAIIDVRSWFGKATLDACVPGSTTSDTYLLIDPQTELERELSIMTSVH